MDVVYKAKPASPEGGAATSSAPSRLVLVGNPNVGKSVIFGLLTGRYATVSNFPGTTVTLTRGHALIDGIRTQIIDTPGVNSLIPMSEDERVTRDLLLEHAGQSLLQVVDARNLRRGLLISVHLAEMEVPFSLALNMTDEAKSLGLGTDCAALSAQIGVPVTQTVAVRRAGIDRMRRTLGEQCRSSLRVSYPPVIESAIAEIEPLLVPCRLAPRSLALTVLAGDPSIVPWLARRIDRDALAVIEAVRARTASRLAEPASVTVNRSRLRVVDAIVGRVQRHTRRRAIPLSESLGQLAIHPVWGIPVLLVVLYLMYEFVGVFGAGSAVDFLESTLFARYLSPWSIQLVDALLAFPHEHLREHGVRLVDYALVGELDAAQRSARLAHDFLVGPFGQLTMAMSYAIALILPIVATFFIAFGLLEDSGYLPRLAVMVNRIFRNMGLNGKAVLPMVLGLGCDTMATLTTRVLETRKERILVTLLLALGVPCSAQLGVIFAMTRALSLPATLVWMASVLLTLFLVGWIAARLVSGERADFVLELPPIRIPQPANILLKTVARIEWYLREAVPLFALGTALLFVLDASHALGVVQAGAAPLVRGVLGLPVEATESFLVGFLRRDYGAAGLYSLARDGGMDSVQLVVSMVTITLFVPCIANLLIMIKERGIRVALLMVAIIVPTAFLVGGTLNWLLRALQVSL